MGFAGEPVPPQIGSGADAGSAPDYGYRGKHLQLRFTVEDEGVFTMPWTATITYRRGIEAWRKVVCPENTRELAMAGRAAALPTAPPAGAVRIWLCL